MKIQAKFRCAPLLAFLLLFTVDIHAQANASGANSVAEGSAINLDTPTAELAMEQVREELADVEGRWYGLMRVRWSYTQKASAALGAIFTEQRKDVDCSDTCMMHGWHFEVEPGLYGMQGSVGWGRLVAETGSTERLLQTVYIGWAVRGVVLRTWGDSPLTPTSQTLVGIEGDYSLLRINYSLGVLRSLDSDSSRNWVIAVGIGWGF